MTDTRALRRVAKTRQAIARAEAAHLEAVRDALKVHASADVAEAMGLTRQGMYKALSVAARRGVQKLPEVDEANEAAKISRG